MKADAIEATEGKYSGLTIDISGLGKVQLTHILKQTTETTIYLLSHPGIVVKTFDLSCGKPGEVSYGPYLRFNVELENFQSIMGLEALRDCVPTYYGANIDYEREYAYIAMEFLEGQDLQSWCDMGAVGGYEPEWVEEFKEAIYEAFSIMTRFHRHGILLIDFKPDNIIRRAYKGVKFVDLGSFFTPKHQSAIEKYLYSATPDYAELLIDAINIQTGLPPSEASDIFSAGVALFEMATGNSRLEMDEGTADEILNNPGTYKFRDSQIRDLWREYPHLQEVLPLVETQLQERRLLFAEVWHLLKAYVGFKVPNWEELGGEERDQIILATGTTFIQEQLPEQLQWLAGAIAKSTVLRSMRFKRIAELMKDLAEPLPNGATEDLERNSPFIQYLRDMDHPTSFLADLNTWEGRINPGTGHWAIAVPLAYLHQMENAQFTYLKQNFREGSGHRFYNVVGEMDADETGDDRLTLWNLKDDHCAWIC